MPPPPRPPGRRPAPPAPPVVVWHRKPADGGHAYCAVHPGALPADVWAVLAAALPERDGLAVLDLAGVPAYFEAALSGDHGGLTLDALADRFTAEYRAVRREQRGDGGSTLLGWSFGGVIAQAVVERLEPAERPARLALLDSIAPTEDYQPPDDAFALSSAMLLRWFAMYLGAKRDRTVPVGPGDLAAGLDAGLVRVLDAATACGALPHGTPLPGLRKLYDTYVDGLLRNNRLTAGHRPGPSSVPLLLVKAAGSLIPEDETLGWDELARYGLTVHTAPGDHYTMLTRPDSAAAIAGLLRRS